LGGGQGSERIGRGPGRGRRCRSVLSGKCKYIDSLFILWLLSIAPICQKRFCHFSKEHHVAYDIGDLRMSVQSPKSIGSSVTDFGHCGVRGKFHFAEAQ
jgi:hypothetical protein